MSDPPLSKTQAKKQKRAEGKQQQAPKQGASSERERFQLDGDEDWTMIANEVAKRHHAQQQQLQQQRKAKPSKATIEEILPGEESDDDNAAPAKKAAAPKQQPAPKKGGLTPTQRKSLQRGNKNPHTGAPKKATVEVEDGLINEEDEGVAGLSDSDSDNEGDREAGSESDEDGEADWEKEPVVAAPVAKAGKAGKAAKSESSFPSYGTLVIWLSLALIVAGLLWIRLQDSGIWTGIDINDVDITTKPPTEQDDFYHVLQVERDASLKQIKTSYRKLVLVTHPDKNPGCKDCSLKFQKVQKAYDVLSSPEKRSMYDSMETVFEVLSSETTELTSANFDSEVLQQDGVVVIQIYTDWHKSAIRFSQAWEEAATRYGQLVSFGRVHAQRERELTKRLPLYKFGVLPTVLIYSNGQFTASKTFTDSSHKALSQLCHFIAQQFPNTVTAVPNTVSSIRDFIGAAQQKDDQATVLFVPDFAKNAAQARRAPPPRSGSQSQRAQQQALQAQLVNEPSLTYKAVARKFQYSVNFGQVDQIKEPSAWKSWIKEVSKAFKLAPPSRLPAVLYQEADETSPKWLTGDLNKSKLLSHMAGMHRRMVPWFNSHSYARHCVDMAAKPSAVCVIALACSPLKIGDLEYNTFASGARALQKQAAFRNANLQFAKVDVAKQTDMAPLCQALPLKAQQSTELSIVVLTKHATEMAHFGSSDHPNQQFDSWLHHIIKEDGKVESFPAPLVAVVHVPDDVLAVTLPVFGVVFVPLKWLYGVCILIVLVVGAPIISQYFTNFLVLVFALSIIVPGFELLRDVYEKHY